MSCKKQTNQCSSSIVAGISIFLSKLNTNPKRPFTDQTYALLDKDLNFLQYISIVEVEYIEKISELCGIFASTYEYHNGYHTIPYHNRPLKIEGNE